ncbi:MAG: cation transporter [Ruminococcaceae bacterium]|nr:cation transporter [Oscillospiraceae bacterium]
MIKLLLRFFVKNHENTTDKNVREKYGVLGGILGIICNLFLFGLKLVIGSVMGSMAITSDAFNNLSDTGSSIVSILGAKISNKKPDKDHPFGHGRFEYISSLVVSFIIMLVGFNLLTDSFEKILHPTELVFNLPALIILVLSMSVKVWMYSYNLYLSKKIDSGVLMATAKDSMNDVISTGAVIVATVIGYFTGIYIIDGIVSLIVSAIIMYAGFGIAKDVIGTLLGTAPEPSLVKSLTDLICGHDEIIGIHDLIVHDYGPGRIIASVHAEVPDNGNIVHVHEIIDDIEQDAMKEFDVMLVIHMDPVCTNCEATEFLRQKTATIVSGINSDFTIHDFRITDGEHHKNLIFDVVVPAGTDEMKKEEIRKDIARAVAEYDSGLRCVITVDTLFV